MNRNVIFRVAIMILVSVASGCTKTEIGKVEKSVLFAKTSLEEVDHNKVAQLSFGDIMASGGTPVTYIAASTENTGDLLPFIYGGPAQPWSVIIRKGEDTNSFIIEGYADDLKKPVIVDKAVILWKFTPRGKM